jgi:hypothetical protein
MTEIAASPGTHIPPNMSATPEELHTEVRRLVDAAVRLARLRHRALPAVGSAAWWSAPDDVRLATILVLGESYVIRGPAEAAAAQLKAVSNAISGALDWSANAHRLIFESPGKLAARRAVVATPVRCAHRGCPAVVSVEHPLPDFRTVRCPRHDNHSEAAA